MGVEAGKNVVLKLTDNGDTERTLSAYVTKLSLSLKGKALVDVTAMGDSGHTWASDELEDGSFSVDFLYDSASNTVWDTLCGASNGLRGQTAAKAFEIGPQGSSSGEPKITGTCWLEEPPLEAAIGDVIRMTGVTFRIDGAVTIGTYT